MKVRATLGAILDILGGHVEIDADAGVTIDRSRPASHHAIVPARDHALLDDWELVARGRTTSADGALRVIRGRATLALLERALARTMPIVHVMVREGRRDDAGRWLERFHLHVAAVRARAVGEAVSDDIDERAARLVASEPYARVAERLGAPIVLGPTPLGSGGLARLGLERCLCELQRTARDVHATAIRLDVALELAGEPQVGELARALAIQLDGLRRNLRDLHLGPYLERVRAPTRHDDPGRHPLVRARLLPLLALPSATDSELLATSDCFVAVALACVENAARIVSDAFARRPAPPALFVDVRGRPPGVPTPRDVAFEDVTPRPAPDRPRRPRIDR